MKRGGKLSYSHGSGENLREKKVIFNSKWALSEVLFEQYPLGSIRVFLVKLTEMQQGNFTNSYFSSDIQQNPIKI